MFACRHNKKNNKKMLTKRKMKCYNYYIFINEVIAMKRITSACLLQTIRFDKNNGANPQDDYKHYLATLDKKRIKYEIVETQNESDGCLIVKIKKSYTNYSTEGYFA